MKYSKVEEVFSKVSEIVLENGFKIIYYEDERFEKYYTEMTVKYGSLDYSYLKNGKKKEHNKGIAHFLEHVMFNMPYGDGLSKFNEILGSANAYTSYDKTSYLVTFSKNLDENIKTLLDLVTTLYIDEAKVEKEKGIIIEEVGLYDKDPEWKIYKDTLQNSMENIKYKDDILGSKEDVNTMTYDMLKEAYDDFYRPDNQYIVVVGPDVKNIVDYIKNYMSKKENNNNVIKRIKDKEKFLGKDLIFKSVNEVSKDYINISYKYVLEGLEDSYENTIHMGMYLDLFYSFFNKHFINAEEQGIIDYSFDYDNILYSNMILIMFFITGKNLEKFKEFLNTNNIYEYEILEGVNSLINSKIGKILKKFDDEILLAKFLNSLCLHDVSVKEYYEYVENFNLGKVRGLLQNENKIEIINIISSKK